MLNLNNLKMTNLEKQLETMGLTLGKFEKQYLQSIVNAWKEAGKEMSKEDLEKIVKIIQNI